MSNLLNYFCEMIVSEVICSFCGCHGESSIPCCVIIFSNTTTYWQSREKEKSEVITIDMKSGLQFIVVCY